MAVFEVPTRQKADLLFEAPAALVGAGDEVCLPVREVRGYAFVNLLLESDQPFSVRAEQGCACDPSAMRASTTLPSSPHPSGHVLCSRVLPCGTHMRLCVRNTGPSAQSRLVLCGTGVPQP